MKNKKLLILLPLLASLASCQGKTVDITVDVTTDRYLSGEEYSFEHENGPECEIDDDIVVDGELDDELYSSLKWLDLDYATDSFVVNMKMTAHLAKHGVFYAFEVDDPLVYYSAARSSSYNTGVELYIAPAGSTALANSAFEIGLHPNNVYQTRLHYGGNYYIFDANYKDAPYIRSKILGETLNTGESDGYIMEVFLPYGLFGLTSAPTHMNSNVSLIRTFDNSPEKSRLWYNFGENLKNGYAWGNPETWWKFDAGGAKILDFNMITGDGGEVKVSSKNICEGDSYQIIIKPDNDKILNSIKINNLDFTDQISYTNTGLVINVENAIGDQKIETSFAKYPETNVTLSGKVTFCGYTLTPEEAKDMEIEYRYYGNVKTFNISNSGSYSINIPSGRGMFLLKYKESGDIIRKMEVNYSETTTLNIDLDASEYGDYKALKYDGLTSSTTAATDLFETNSFEHVSKLAINEFTLKYNGKIFGDNGEILDDPTGGKANAFTAVNIKSYLHTLDASGNPSPASIHQVNVQLLHWNNAWSFKLITRVNEIDDTVVSTSALDADQLRLIQSGAPLAITYNNGTISLFMKQDNVYMKLAEATPKADFSNSYVKRTAIYLNSPVASATVSDGKFYYVENETLPANYFTGSYVNFDRTYNAKVSPALSLASQKLLIDNGLLIKATMKIPEIVSGENIVYKDGAYTTLNFHFYAQEGKAGGWQSYDLDLLGSTNKYTIRFTNNNRSKVIGTLDLTEAQIRKLASSGLQLIMVKGGANGDFEAYVNDGSNNVLVGKLSTSSVTLSTHYFTNLDELYTGFTSSISLTDTAIYTKFQSPLSIEDLLTNYQ